MKKIKQIVKIPFKPYWKLKRILKNRYSPAKYWENRHKSFSDTSLKGVGHIKKTEEQNKKDYQKAKDIFVELCKSQKINFESCSVLEIGCGNGFYTDIIAEMGCKDYTGIDIAEYPLKKLREKYPDYCFKKMDISSNPLDKEFDIIIMIDVTQHIVKDNLFFAAMENIKHMLKTENSKFIVTSWLSEIRTQKVSYEVQRPLSYYKQTFDSFVFSKPVNFRDKYIFAIYN